LHIRGQILPETVSLLDPSLFLKLCNFKICLPSSHIWLPPETLLCSLLNLAAYDTTFTSWIRCGVCRGDRSSKADYEEERSGYGERAEEGFLSPMALVTTVTEEASMHEVTFVDNLLV
jgi:hypothetical protein